MKTNFREFIDNTIKFLTNRLFIMFIIVVIAFYALVVKLFEIQIIKGEEYRISAQKSTKPIELPITAPRGEIYDRYGRPLAVNKIAFTVKIDPSVNKKMNADIAYEFIKLMERNGEELVDDFPISKDEPYTFHFNDSEKREERWKLDMGVKLDADPYEAFASLKKLFSVPDDLPDEEARKILSLCSSVYLQRISKNHITIAFNVKDITVAAIGEKKLDFPGFYVDVEYLREYPRGENFSHMLGYIRSISEEELNEKKDLGYSFTSIVGQVGLEKAFENELRGQDGKMIVESDNSGVRVSSSRVTEPVQGDKIILTVDARMQDKCAEILENQLKTVLLNKFKGISSKEAPITSKELLISMINSNNISVDYIMESKEDSYSYSIRQYIEENYEIDRTDEKYKEKLKKFITEKIDSNNIATGYILLSMYEQGIITLEEGEITKLSKNNNNVPSIIIKKMEQDEITPQMTALDPSTGSIVLVDLKNGGIISAASYPTYDNNKFVNNFNNEYFYKLMNDTTTPMMYRAFSEPRAPGSTFKMITAISALETNAITTKTLITDRGEFRDAGWPYLKCWIRYYPYHSTINVTGALEVSCNYFFSEAAYRMGNTRDETKYEGISKLNNYMSLFGLGERSGVEITELYDFRAYTSMDENILKVSSPGLKAYNEKGRNPELTDAEVRWTDGNTIQTAIGQSYNNYTAANMAKYIATLANGGDRYQLHFLNKIESSTGELVREFQPNIETHIDIKPENLQAVYDGMLAVTQGNNGTARSVFKDFPIKVGAKTGTAEQVIDHASFAAYAPFDDPQIAVYVLIPNGGTLTTAAPAAQVGKEVIEAYFGLLNEPQKAGMNNTLAK